MSQKIINISTDHVCNVILNSGQYISQQRNSVIMIGTLECSKNKDQNITIALKKIIRCKQSSKKVQQELLKLNQQETKFIAKLYEVKQTLRKPRFLVVQYCNSGSLQNLLSLIISKRVNISLETKFGLMLQILNGYKVLINKKIVHDDISPRNILLSKITRNDGQWLVCKFIDFEQSSLLNEEYKNNEYRFTKLYTHPLKLQRALKTPLHQSDIYGLGVIFYQLLHHQHPFRQYNQNSSKQPYNQFVREKKFQSFSISENSSSFQKVHNLILSMIGKEEIEGKENSFRIKDFSKVFDDFSKIFGKQKMDLMINIRFDKIQNRDIFSKNTGNSQCNNKSSFRSSIFGSYQEENIQSYIQFLKNSQKELQQYKVTDIQFKQPLTNIKGILKQILELQQGISIDNLKLKTKMTVLSSMTYNILSNMKECILLPRFLKYILYWYFIFHVKKVILNRQFNSPFLTSFEEVTFEYLQKLRTSIPQLVIEKCSPNQNKTGLVKCSWNQETVK